VKSFIFEIKIYPFEKENSLHGKLPGCNGRPANARLPSACGENHRSLPFSRLNADTS
jgi:hypothetical protein